MSIVYRCRFCLKSSRNKIDVFKDDFPKMIEILTGLKVDPHDDFPKTSCIDCAKNVKIALRTRKQIIQAHKDLLEEFLMKCRETDNFESDINERGSNIVVTIADKTDCTNTNNKCREADNFESNPDKRVSKILIVDKPAYTNTKNKLEIASPTRKGTRTRSLNLTRVHYKLEDSNAITNIDNKNDEKNVEDSTLEATSKIEILNSSVVEEPEVVDYTRDDSNISDPPSPLSDPASDVDWAPDKEDCNEPTEAIKQESSNTVPHARKSSDDVFFVKKRKSPSSRNQKSPDTVIRIKKKPKGRLSPKRVTCDICKREVQSYWLQKHLETHQYNPVTCEFCGLVSKSATALRHHVFYYHKSTANEYMCDQCGRSFRSKYRLNLHKKKEHGGTKDFECTTCGKKFFERMHLKRHVDKTHKNIRPYVCDFCGKSFKSKNHIKIHERIHSKEAPYNCHMCGESFKMKLTLRTHLKGVHNVHEEQKVFCDICKRGFASDVALKAHLNSRIHETEKCQYCSEMFTREYIVNHLRDMHGIGNETL